MQIARRRFRLAVVLHDNVLDGEGLVLGDESLGHVVHRGAARAVLERGRNDDLVLVAGACDGQGPDVGGHFEHGGDALVVGVQNDAVGELAVVAHEADAPVGALAVRLNGLQHVALAVGNADRNEDVVIAQVGAESVGDAILESGESRLHIGGLRGVEHLLLPMDVVALRLLESPNW